MSARAAGKSTDNVNSMLDELETEAIESPEQISLGQVLEKIGTRSYGPVLVILSLIAFTPLGGLPGVPHTMAAIVVVIAGELVLGVRHIWLPRILLQRSVEPQKLKTGIMYMRPVARFIDGLLRPRLQWLTTGVMERVAAGICVVIALSVPFLELVPFASSPSWATIGIFGLALVANDGVMTVVALIVFFGSASALYSIFL